MRRLLLLRHAKSDWSSPGMADVMRPLNDRGEAAARLMGGYMARHGLIPDRVVCSTATRTRETWAGLCAQWPAEVPVASEESLYAAAPQTILSVVRDAGEPARTLLVIGHNPGIHEVANLLIASGDVEMRERLREKFPTAGLAVIDFTAKMWNRIREQSGRLERFVTPRAVAAATK